MSELRLIYERRSLRPLAAVRRLRHVRKPFRPAFLLTHHKTGTVLLGKVFEKVSQHLNTSMSKAYGYFDHLQRPSDTILFEHSLLSRRLLDSDFRGVHLRRDPRDIVVSAYLYHKKTAEAWCTHVPAGHSGHQTYPAIPYEREHRSAPWKANYLDRLNGRSYQQVLCDLGEEDGLIWEMENCAGWAISDLLAWDYTNPRILEMKLEEIVDSFDDSFGQIFDYLGFSYTLSQELLQLIQAENLKKMPDERLRQSSHIHSRKICKWRRYFSERVSRRFVELYPGAAQRLGYESA